MIFGYLIGVAIISSVNALFIILAVRIFTARKTSFGKAFGISFVSFIAALFSQMLFDGVRPKSSFIEALPGFIFFLSCWLLNAQFIRYDEQEDSKNYGKAFAATLIQCVVGFIFGLVFFFVLFGFLMSRH